MPKLLLEMQPGLVVSKRKYILIFTPGKLSQVPPAEVLIVGCDRYPEVPVSKFSQ